MPRATDGTYSLPEAPFQSGTVADPAKVNSVLSDLGAALGDSLSRSGKGAMSVDLPMGGHKVTGAGDGTVAGDLVTFGQVAAVSGAVTAEAAARAALAATFATAVYATVIAPSGPVDAAGAVPSKPGVTFYAPGSLAVVHMANSGSSGTNTILALQRSSGTTGDFLTFYTNGGSVLGGIAFTGSGMGYNTTSDHRLKRDVRPVEGALQAVLAGRPVRYAWRSDPDQHAIGFIAHELQAVVPEAVTGTLDAVDEEGRAAHQAVNLAGLVPVLWAAVQELAVRVAALEVQT